MYKLFLTLRYLTRRKIVIFPILVVWLCVMMLVIVSGIMGGFVDRVRETNHDLYGDVIISAQSFTVGFSGYDELRSSLQKEFKDEIEATTPTIETYALIYIPSAEDSRPAMLVGVNPEERSKVTKFRESLFNQYTAPLQAVADLSPRLPASREELIDYARKRQADSQKLIKDLSDRANTLVMQRQTTVESGSPNLYWLWGIAPLCLVLLALFFRARRKHSGWALLATGAVGVIGLVIIALGVLWPVMFPRELKLLEDRLEQAYMDRVQAERTLHFALGLHPGQYPSREQLAKAIVPPVPSFTVPEGVLQESTTQPGGRPTLPEDGCIVGAQMGFFLRDTRGNFIRRSPEPLYRKVIITIFPANINTKTNIGNVNIDKNNAVQQGFTIVDDSHTGVFDIDQANVYAPFDIVQQRAGLAPDPEIVAQGGENFPKRCQQILIKLKDSSAYRDIRDVRARIAHAVEQFQEKWDNDPKHQPMADGDLVVQTWDEKQSKYLGAVQNEKVMVIFCLGLMSLVVLVVIFLIFYQIVRDKTRDIGIIKAVGGSEEGVAGIFLTFGLFIGVVGGGLGVLGGWLFVTHTNQIHEWIFRTTGIIIWDRSVYLFDRIPDVVHLSDVITYFIVAVAAGVFGALIPALIAGAEDPVQAVRYE